MEIVKPLKHANSSTGRQSLIRVSALRSATEECFVCVRCGFGFPDGRVYKKAAALSMHPFGFCRLGVSG